MKIIKRSMPFLILLGILGMGIGFEVLSQKTGEKLEQRNNVGYVVSESTKEAEKPLTATDWESKDYSILNEFQKSMVKSFGEGVYQLEGDLVVIKMPPLTKMTFKKQFVDTDEVRIVDYKETLTTELKDMERYLIGHIELSKEASIGVYDEEGNFLY